MKKISIILLAMFAVCAAAFASDGSSADVADSSSAMGYVVAAIIAAINALLSFAASKKDAWWYKTLSWISVRFGK
mgnify:CR=1 FL=1